MDYEVVETAVLMHCILIPTVPKTGTNFLMEFFRSFAGHVVALEAVCKNSMRFQHNTPGLVPDRTNLVWGHITEERIDFIKVLAQWWKPIVPLRDPLASSLRFCASYAAD